MRRALAADALSRPVRSRFAHRRVRTDSSVHEGLAARRLAVVDDVIEPTLLARAEGEAAAMLARGDVFRDTHGQGVHVRRDLTLWLDEASARERGMPATAAVIGQLRARLAAELATAAGSAAAADADVLLPRRVMLSCYNGDGTHYVAHRDALAPLDARGTWASATRALGALFRRTASAAEARAGLALLSERLGGTSEQSYRALTSILYLNRREWPLERCGGGLRCFVGARADDESGESAGAVETLAPRGGRLVVFPSREVLHEVLPTWCPRFALTAWLFEPRILDENPELGEACVAAGGAAVPSDSSRGFY